MTVYEPFELRNRLRVDVGPGDPRSGRPMNLRARRRCREWYGERHSKCYAERRYGDREWITSFHAASPKADETCVVHFVRLVRLRPIRTIGSSSAMAG